MSYIILNGKKSTLVKGLLISSLPPITKPMIRTQIETVDGRDGDIVTKLGYSAYDKKMKIGLFGDYDIDEIISYFNSSGQVIFSNELDKFYDYQILQQIDFERLVRFRTATVTFHVQPFKYSAVDDTVMVRSSLFHLKPYEVTKNGVTVSVQNGALSFEGTATENTEIYLPIEQMEIQEYHPGTYRYTLGYNGGVITSYTKGSFEFRIIGDRPTDEDSLGGTSYTLNVGTNITVNYEDTERKVYKYLWIRFLAGQEFTSYFEPIISVTDNDIDVNGLTYINAGNIESKPIFTIKGNGTVHLWINGESAFTLNLGETTNTVTVNTQTLNAYSGDVLKNRDVTGDLAKVSFKPGKNTIYLYGNTIISELTVERESRWI